MAIEYLRSEPDYDPDAMVTELTCSCCQQEVEGTEEVTLLQIVQPQMVNGHLEVYPVLTDTGDFQFTPLFVHLDACWKDVQEGIGENAQDTPPVEDENAILVCEFCGSGIRAWEYMALGQYGEFYCSPRQPKNDGKILYTFRPWVGQDVVESKVCLSCITRIGEDTLDDWKDVSQLGECVFCTHARCWRDPSCSCFCHAE